MQPPVRFSGTRWAGSAALAALLLFLSLSFAALAQEAPSDVEYAKRWWNALTADQMVASLYGEEATPEQQTAAKKMYGALDPETKRKVNQAAAEIYGTGGHRSVGAWWETLDCRKMRIAAGDGNTADATSAFCTHYPGSGHPKILNAASLERVNKVGQALLGRNDPGVYPPDNEYAKRWWNALTADQMVASLYGEEATPEQQTAAKKMYGALDPETKRKVNQAAAEIYGTGGHRSVGAWWETLDCRQMRNKVGPRLQTDARGGRWKHGRPEQCLLYALSGFGSSEDPDCRVARACEQGGAGAAGT